MTTTNPPIGGVGGGYMAWVRDVKVVKWEGMKVIRGWGESG